MQTFIDHYSWKCMLGPRAKNIEENENFAKWQVDKKTHIILFQSINKELITPYIPFNFHYFSPDDLSILKDYEIEKSKIPSIYFELGKTLNLSGKKTRGIRNRINRCGKLNLEILPDYKNISDVKEFINVWSDIYSYKYFRDYSGKNLYFFSNNFHKDCICSFIYKDNKLVAYGCISPPNGLNSTYILGKAFYNYNDGKRKFEGISGLSEFLDIGLYRKAYEMGARYVNLGGSFTKDLLEYKRKFPGSVEFVEYEGKVKEKI